MSSFNFLNLYISEITVYFALKLAQFASNNHKLLKRWRQVTEHSNISEKYHLETVTGWYKIIASCHGVTMNFSYMLKFPPGETGNSPC